MKIFNFCFHLFVCTRFSSISLDVCSTAALVQGNYFGLDPIYGINVYRVGERMNMVKVLENERDCNG